MSSLINVIFFPETWPSLVMNVLILIFTIVLLRVLSNHLRDSHHCIKGMCKSHYWREIRKAPEHAWWCNMCESLLMNFQGFYCESCGAAAGPSCMKRADAQLKCKPVSMPGSSLKHHWVRGNLRDIGECLSCHEECGSEGGMVDWRCAWCQGVAHTHCKQNIAEEECDLGRWARFIVSPLDVSLDSKGRAVLPLQARPGAVPLFVVGNRNSGSGEAVEAVLSSMRALLNGSVQVFDDPSRWELAREALGGGREGRRRVVVAVGGDGTAASLLTLLRATPSAALAVLPLGTGNDLSRSLGWGPSLSGPLDPVAFLHSLAQAEVAPLDRWLVTLKGGGRRSRRVGRRPPLFAYNYLSVGVDAKVALDFHNTRRSPLYPPGSSFLNKALYLCFGTQQVVERGCQGLEERVELFLDGAPLPAPLPPLEAIVLLNIHHWGAGVRLWSGEGQSLSDGKLEVLGIYSSFHIAQLQVGLSKPLVIGQASSVKIKLKAPTPMQVDGEPWVEGPTEITVTHDGQSTVLMAKSQTSPKSASPKK